MLQLLVFLTGGYYCVQYIVPDFSTDFKLERVLHTLGALHTFVVLHTFKVLHTFVVLHALGTLQLPARIVSLQSVGAAASYPGCNPCTSVLVYCVLVY